MGCGQPTDPGMLPQHDPACVKLSPPCESVEANTAPAPPGSTPISTAEAMAGHCGPVPTFRRLRRALFNNNNIQNSRPFSRSAGPPNTLPDKFGRWCVPPLGVRPPQQKVAAMAEANPRKDRVSLQSPWGFGVSTAACLAGTPSPNCWHPEFSFYHQGNEG